MTTNIDALVVALENNGIEAKANDELTGVLMNGDDLDTMERVCSTVVGTTVYPCPTDHPDYDYDLYLH